MATENKSKPSNSGKNNKKRKHYLPYNKAVKKGAYPLRPGVQGFFITCDGGKEHQASNEAINVIDTFYEELVEGTETKVEQAALSKKPLNKITKFTDSDSSSSDNDDDEDANEDHADDNEDVKTRNDKNKHVVTTGGDANDESGPENKDGVSVEKQTEENTEKPENQDKQRPENKDGVSVEKQTEENTEKPENQDKQEAEAVEPPVKKQCVEADAPDSGNLPKKVEDKKSVDKLIEAELAELGDRSKRRFSKLDSGCNGVVFIQMRKIDGDPSPKDIVQHMMTSLASTKKHVSRFLLRVLPVEVSCYTSEEEIKRAITPVIDKYFPVETEVPRKFAVLYDARANTGVDRTKVIDAVAKSVPSLHKVDLANPDINIVVQIVKTVCLIGVVEKYKELAKFNIRQLTSPKQ
ncbi:THUMP domain-containing protein 1 [Sesamum alatum]|uniref:THUMP domain-containing protein 1 n=1 Tax=Sesamum alatum TaxID=300844 RepID=A0AAE1Z437_9LAMI|nr:THUMP domain-containing protein 1 [Sesamum alatum]